MEKAMKINVKAEKAFKFIYDICVNFILKESDLESINKIPGVKKVYFKNKYTFGLLIGEAFEPDTVVKEIKKYIYENHSLSKSHNLRVGDLIVFNTSLCEVDPE